MQYAQNIAFFIVLLGILVIAGYFAFQYRNELIPSNKEIKYTCPDGSILKGEDETLYCAE